MRKIVSLLCAAGCVAALSVPALAAGPTVRVADDYFKAKTVRITKGSTVTWKWVGSDDHQIAGRGFRSRLRASGTYRHKFTKHGTFRYICTVHVEQGMKGTVIVR